MGNNMDRDAFLILLRAMSGEENVLENFEKERGEEAARSNYLAKRMKPEKEIWELLGFTFTDIPGDDVLCQANLPKGWKIVDTEHHMYKDIIDEMGRKRGSMFYKAAIYDKSAHMSLVPRYGVNVDYDDNGNETIYFGNEEERLFVSGKLGALKSGIGREGWEKYSADRDALLCKARAYGNEYYPGFENVLAYWGEPEKEKQPKLD
jgi:hypothetical protein